MERWLTSRSKSWMFGCQLSHGNNSWRSNLLKLIFQCQEQSSSYSSGHESDMFCWIFSLGASSAHWAILHFHIVVSELHVLLLWLTNRTWVSCLHSASHAQFQHRSFVVKVKILVENGATKPQSGIFKRLDFSRKYVQKIPIPNSSLQEVYTRRKTYPISKTKLQIFARSKSVYANSEGV